MDEKNKTLEENGLEINDSQTFSIRETKEIKIRGIPEDTFIRYRDYARKYSKGNWTRALQMLLDAGEIMPLIKLIIEKNELEKQQLLERIEQIEEKINKEEDKGKKKIRTFGGE